MMCIQGFPGFLTRIAKAQECSGKIAEDIVPFDSGRLGYGLYFCRSVQPRSGTPKPSAISPSTIKLSAKASPLGFVDI